MDSKTILYLDPFSGIAGDMLIGALLDLGLDLAKLHHELSKLKLSGYRLGSRRVMRGSMTAIKFDVEIDGVLETAQEDSAIASHSHSHEQEHGHGHVHSHEHGHAEIGDKVLSESVQRSFAEIKALIENSVLSPKVKENSLAAFGKLAEAEARIHNVPVEQVHFHEVGALDSIVDMVGACIGLELLGIDEIHCGPMALGSGYVRCQHGLMPVPAPATLELVKGIPLRTSPVEKELTTPTGAALVAALARSFGPLPSMNIVRIGYGAGSRTEQAVPNVLRAVLGTLAGSQANESECDTIVQIQTNVDDCSPEVLGYLAETLFEHGALDVFFTPIQMKKTRPAQMLTVLAEPEQLDKMAAILFKECSTFGLRYQTCARMKLNRRIERVDTVYGSVRVKVGSLQGCELSAHPEFEDCRALAKEKGVALRVVIEAAKVAYGKAK